MRSKSSNIYLLLISVIIGVCCRAPFVFAQASSERIQKAKEYFSAGREFIRQGNFTAADIEFKKAQQLLGVTSAVSPVQLKTSPALTTQSPEKTKETKTDAFAKDPVSYYIKEIRLKPKNADLHYNLGLEYLKINDFKLAEEEFKRAVQLNHRDKESCYNLGVLYEIYLGNKQQAIYYYRKYISLAPRGEDVWRVKVWIYDLKKQISKENE